MDLTLSYHSDIGRDIESALQHDKAEEAARRRQGLEAGVRIVESWVLRSGGRMLGSGSSDGSCQVPAEYLEELPDIVRQFEEASGARMFVGVGAEPSEAVHAMHAAEKRGGSPAIVLYTPDLTEDEVKPEDDELSQDEAEALEEDDSGKLADAGEQPFLGKAQFDEPKPAGEATQIQQGTLSPTAAAPSAPPSASYSSAVPGQSPGQPGGQAPAQPGPGEPENDDQVLQAVGAVLNDFKTQLPFFEQQVKQANPQAYQATMGMVQAMIAMAQQLAQGGPESTPPPEAGGPPVKKAEVEVPPKHQAGIKVPEGGSSCANCKWMKTDGRKATCGSKYFQEWNGGDIIPVEPANLDSYCSDWWEPAETVEKGEKTEVEPHEEMPDAMKLAKLYRAAVKSMMEKGELDATMPEPFSMNEYVNGWYHERAEHPHIDDHATTMVVLQHLKEHPHYYSNLKTAEETGQLDKDEYPGGDNPPLAHNPNFRGGESSKRNVADHPFKDVPRETTGGTITTVKKDEPAPSHAAHTYPVGSIVHARVKVIEPTTGKVSWHQARAGQKMAGDGHALSPRVTECPQADTPETRLAAAGLTGGQDPNAAPPTAQPVTLPGAK